MKKIELSRRRFLTGNFCRPACSLRAARKPSRRPTANLLRMRRSLSRQGASAACCRRERAWRGNTRAAEISSHPAIWRTNPGDPNLSVRSVVRRDLRSRLRADAFADWRLTVEGSVLRPGAFSARRSAADARADADYAAYVRGGLVIDRRMDGRAAQARAGSRQVPSQRRATCSCTPTTMSRSGIDMIDALHPQTDPRGAGMNGRDLPLCTRRAAATATRNAARVQEPRSSVRHIVVLDSFEDDGSMRDRLGLVRGHLTAPRRTPTEPRVVSEFQSACGGRRAPDTRERAHGPRSQRVVEAETDVSGPSAAKRSGERPARP